MCRTCTDLAKSVCAARKTLGDRARHQQPKITSVAVLQVIGTVMKVLQKLVTSGSDMACTSNGV
eukprot:5952243-Amphidinium_carterae.1